jgi:hypothetical protein
MLHWGQGTMFKALAHLLTKMSGKSHVSEPDDGFDRSELRIPGNGRASI